MSKNNLIEKYKGSLDSLFSPTFNYTFLVGAGVSMDAPTNMPSAVKIVRSLLNLCAPPEEVENLLLLDKLRYELVVEKIQDEFDEDLKFLDYLEKVTSPNAIHMFLGNAIVRGNYVVTTNFDYLIEQALIKILDKQWHQEILPVITKNDFSSHQNPKNLMVAGKYPVYKIHGAKRNIITKDDTKESLITTISSLGREREEGETFAIEPYKKPAVYNLISDRTLVVMGYSGSDDFDLGPTLKELPFLNRLIWIEHSQNEHFEILVVNKNKNIENSEDLSRIEQLLREISISADFEVILIKANTGNFVQTKLWKIFLPQITIEEYKLFESSNDIPDFADWIKPLYEKIPLVKKYRLSTQLYYYLKQIEATLRSTERGISLAEELNDYDSKSYFLNFLGMVYQITGKYEEAIKSYEEALEIDDTLNDIRGKASDFNNIGSIYVTLGKYDQAMEKYHQALKISEELGLKSSKIIDLNNIGMLHEIRGDLDLSLEKYKESLKITEELGDLNNKATVLNNIGKIYSNREEYNLALEYYDEALKISEQLGDLYGKIILLNNIGRIYHEHGQYEEALIQYKRTIEITEQLGDLSKKAGCLNNIGSVHLTQSHFDSALEYYTEALNIEKRLGDPLMIMIYLNNIGMIHSARTEYDLSLKFYQEALNIAETLGDKLKKALLLSKIAGIFMYKEDYHAALEKYNEAATIYGDSGDLQNKASCLSNSGRIYEKFEEYSNALRTFEETLQIDEQLGDLAGVASDYYNLGKIYEVCGDFSDAINSYEKSVGLFTQLNQEQNANHIQERINAIKEKSHF